MNDPVGHDSAIVGTNPPSFRVQLDHLILDIRQLAKDVSHLGTPREHLAGFFWPIIARSCGRDVSFAFLVLTLREIDDAWNRVRGVCIRRRRACVALLFSVTCFAIRN